MRPFSCRKEIKSDFISKPPWSEPIQIMPFGVSVSRVWGLDSAPNWMVTPRERAESVARGVTSAFGGARTTFFPALTASWMCRSVITVRPLIPQATAQAGLPATAKLSAQPLNRILRDAIFENGKKDRLASWLHFGSGAAN
jgi:hypothetical protein